MTTAASAHGMDGSLVVPDWPPLALDEVRALLGQFPGCDEPIQILSASPRPFSAASVVETRGGRVFVKRHARAVRDRDGLLEEHRFLQYLWTQGAAVPRVLASFTGETAIEAGDWTYEVHETPEGIDAYEDAISWTPFRSAAHALAAGKALARLHRAARGFGATARTVRPLVAGFTIFASNDPAAAMESYVAARPALAADAGTRCACDASLELLAPFHAKVLPYLSALPPLWTHNDLHPSNLFWSDTSDDAQTTAVIDFGLANRTNAVHDLAIAVERSVVEWLVLVNDPSHPEDVPVHFDHLETLLAGYEQVQPLSENEAAALAPMTALCHAEFALTEADYFLGVLHAPEKAPMATDGYLVGHARWFASARGRSLLDALRRWAEARRSGMRKAVRG